MTGYKKSNKKDQSKIYVFVYKKKEEHKDHKKENFDDADDEMPCKLANKIKINKNIVTFNVLATIKLMEPETNKNTHKHTQNYQTIGILFHCEKI